MLPFLCCRQIRNQAGLDERDLLALLAHVDLGSDALHTRARKSAAVARRGYGGVGQTCEIGVSLRQSGILRYSDIWRYYIQVYDPSTA